MTTHHLAIEKKRIVHLAEGKFNLRTSKMTTGVIRYGYHDSVAVIDSTKIGKTAEDVLGFGGDVPVVGSLAEAMKFEPEALLIGITPPGGRLPEDMRTVIIEAIALGLDVYAGLHDFLNEDEEIASAAKDQGVMLWDLRKPPRSMPVGGGLTRWSKSYISLMVGSDAAIGKMTVALEIHNKARERGINSEFVATGQCGIAIAGWGSPIDAIPGDFMAGVVERDVLSCDGADMILVEGQGSLYHPGFSSVTLGLIHGACPHSLILCHQSSRTEISNIRDRPIPPLNEVADHYLAFVHSFRPECRVVGVSLNTSGTSNEEARAAVEEAEALLGVPATDPIRFGPDKLVDALENHRRELGM
ncbi:MAG: DUF1611 domain-containing protein [Candidatus Sumerlaeia bacterium]|nr:DUF1611 domain-containing protein [Candidatus Sumerlaeia bacterium]